MQTRNLTLRVPETVYRAARVRAAQEGTSLSAMVSRYLEGLVEDDAEFRRLEALQQEVVERLGAFRGSDRLSRDDLHRR